MCVETKSRAIPTNSRSNLVIEEERILMGREVQLWLGTSTKPLNTEGDEANWPQIVTSFLVK